MLLAGRAAEEIIFGDISGGASNDIERATAIAKKMVTQLGMSDVIGLRSFAGEHSEVFLGKDFSNSQDYSDATAAKIDSEIHNIITESYSKAKLILNENIAKLHFVAEFLVKNEIMDGEQFKAAMEGSPTFEELEEMTEAKKRKSREENDRKRLEERKKLQAEKEATDSKTPLDIFGDGNYSNLDYRNDPLFAGSSSDDEKSEESEPFEDVESFDDTEASDEIENVDEVENDNADDDSKTNE